MCPEFWASLPVEGKRPLMKGSVPSELRLELGEAALEFFEARAGALQDLRMGVEFVAGDQIEPRQVGAQHRAKVGFQIGAQAAHRGRQALDELAHQIFNCGFSHDDVIPSRVGYAPAGCPDLTQWCDRRLQNSAVPRLSPWGIAHLRDTCGWHRSCKALSARHPTRTA